MPIKYKPTEKILDRVTKKVSTRNHYMHTVPTSQLVSDVEEARLTPKRIAKIRKELVRRERIAERARQGREMTKDHFFWYHASSDTFFAAEARIEAQLKELGVRVDV